MKELYIPKGKTLTIDNITADTVIVKGVLNVEGAIHARRVVGSGFINAGRITAKTVRASCIDAGTISAERVVGERIVALELYASRAVVATCYLEAALVDTPKLTASRFSIDEQRIKRLVYLPDRSGGMLRTILASQLRTLVATLRGWWSPKSVSGLVDTAVSDDVQDADYAEVEPAKPSEVDFERRRVLALYDLMKDSGYVLRLIPTEETASAKAEKRMEEERTRLHAA